METLYDLLGALPRDDAEGLRMAFRQAVKGTHPDLHPGDPDAGRKFRQIMRAQEILLDSEQRAAYDHLLELARVEEVQKTRAGKIHQLASWVMALAGASAVSIAGLAVVALLWTSTEPSAGTDLAADEPAPPKVDTMPEPSPPALPSAAPASPAQTAAASPAETTDEALPPLGPPLDISPPSAAELDRLHGFDHAFADITHAKRLEKPVHNTASSAKKKGPVAIESAAKPETPLPPRRTAAYDPSRQESAAPFGQRP